VLELERANEAVYLRYKRIWYMLFSLQHQEFFFLAKVQYFNSTPYCMRIYIFDSYFFLIPVIKEDSIHLDI